MTKAKNTARQSPRLTRRRSRSKALVKKPPRADSPTFGGDTQSLVHELQVHQEELEVQNEELRRTQLELEDSRDRFARLYDLSPVGFLTLNSNGVIHEANLTAARMLGLDHSELLKKNFSRFIAPESQDAFFRHRSRFLNCAERQSHQFQMRRHNGTPFTGRLESIAEAAVQGRTIRLLVALIDVTEHLRSEEERSQLAAIVASTDDAIISRDFNDIITTWNGGAERMFGYSASEMVGRPFTAILPRDRRDELRQIQQGIREGDWFSHYETIRIAKDGRHIPVSATISPVRDAGEKIVGIASILRDVTDHQKMEEASRRSESALADFFTEAPLGLLWVSADGRILRVNRAQLEMLGRASKEVLGHAVGEIHVEPGTASAALERLARKETLRNYRASLRHKDGEVRHVLIDANGLWEQGRLVHSRWFVRDVTVRRRLERELLEISERERQRIGHDLHDDLGQQLHGLSYLAALLEKGLQEDASPRVAEVRKLNRFFNETLALTRGLAHGLQAVKPVPDGLMLALRELASRMRGIYGVDCRFEYRAPVLIQRHTAATHLYRIAQEAVNNAIKHGKPTRIRIQLSSAPQRIVLGIRDNGAGIRPLTNGSKGMGLHVMQYRADAINGSLAVRRHPQGGTEVVCTVTRQTLLVPEK